MDKVKVLDKTFKIFIPEEEIKKREKAVDE